uniref:KamA family radical SAM protein n=1 Tax=Ndongobacter massiliensis TaxID=1871025 RepID=UPI0009313B6C|nr:KamA family radical SAM protein [Ndongobacter massiliensis]
MIQSWKEELQNNITKLEDLKDPFSIPPEEWADLKTVITRHPMNITRYYASLIDLKDPKDPIRRMCIPHIEELDGTGSYDTSGEESNTVLSGVQHKYPQTALVLTTNICFMYCRHCFRKRLVGYTRDEILSRRREAVEYIWDHKEIDNVLLSGGDFLTLNNAQIAEYFKELTRISHLDFIRMGSRIPVVFPMRISEDTELLDIFEKYNQKKRIMLVSQFNHPRELTNESIAAIRAVQETGVDVLNQTVLLKGINDSVETLTALMKGLMRIAVTPYYIFQCRPVKHVTQHFQIPINQGIELVNVVRDQLSGPSKQFRYAMSHPRGKIELLGKIGEETIFKFAQAKARSDANKMFARKMGNAGWLDPDLNPTPSLTSA